MKKFARALSFGFGLAITPLLIAEDGELDRQDIQALRDWINTKRQVTVREIGGNLSISGEVRAEFQANNEVVGGIQQRGVGSPTSAPTNAYDIEVNLMLDYRSDRTWASIKLEFDNDAGLFTATDAKIRLERALFGVRLWDGDVATFDIEVGRRPLFNFFESKVEFGSRCDGVFFRYDISTESYGDVYAHAVAELLDDRINQYAYLAELGWLSIMDTGLFFKYSVADWHTKELSIPAKWRFDFIVNQWLLGYKFIPEKFGKLIMPYAAFLWNPVAAKSFVTDHEKVNMAGYIGFSMGELRKKGDWAFDANYQVVQAQAIPEFDANGIGLGNVAKTGLYTTTINGSKLVDSKEGAGGSTNYRGFILTLEYLLTNNLNLQQQWQQSMTLDKNIGPFRRYKQYEIEFIYGF